MALNFTESQWAALIGALVGGVIAVISQVVFYILAEKERLREAARAMAKQRLDEFYSPLLTRLLEIEYKLWLDHDVQEAFRNDERANVHKGRWDKRIADEIAALDREIIDIFRSKRWLAFDTTVVECQKLVRYLESSKLSNSLPGSAVLSEWGDVLHLKSLHVDVRQHHICLMKELGVDQCGSAPLIPESAGGFRIEGELPLDKYHASLELRAATPAMPAPPTSAKA